MNVLFLMGSPLLWGNTAEAAEGAKAFAGKCMERR